MSDQPTLIAENIHKRFGDNEVLKGVSVTARQGDVISILGSSGSGKSTFLRCVNFLETPDQGRVVLEGEEVRIAGGKADAKQITRLRSQLGFVFQQFNLLPYASALDNILLPLRFAPKRCARIRARIGDERAEALRLSAALGLDARLNETGAAGALSVGQQQRVAVARALIGAPPLIVADEPTSALDTDAQEAFLDLLFAQTEAAGATLLMVSHDERLADRFDRAIALSDIARVSRGSDAA